MHFANSENMRKLFRINIMSIVSSDETLDFIAWVTEENEDDVFMPDGFMYIC